MRPDAHPTLDTQPGGKSLESALQFDLGICLTGELLIPEMPQLTLPLLTILLRASGYAGVCPRFTRLRRHDYPAFHSLGEVHAAREPPRLPICAGLPVGGLFPCEGFGLA